MHIQPEKKSVFDFNVSTKRRKNQAIYYDKERNEKRKAKKKYLQQPVMKTVGRTQETKK